MNWQNLLALYLVSLFPLCLFSFNKFKKTDSQNVPTQIDDFERRLCPQTQ